MSAFIFLGAFLLLLAYIEFSTPRDYMSFRESLDLADLPIVTFKQGDVKLNLILDTGANYSIIDKEVEKSITTETTEEYSKVIGIEGTLTFTEFKTIRFTYKDKEYEDKFQIMDLSATIRMYKNKKGVTIHGLLGNGFMQKYKYVLDFKKMVAYSKV